MALTISSPASAAVLLLSSVILPIYIAMALFSRKNQFPVAGKTVFLTGGSQGAGKEAARQLAEKGASVAIVARTQAKLDEAVAYIKAGATSPTQRFTTISADLTSADECARALAACTAWNNGAPPDVVWCSAGTASPTLFADTPTAVLDAQMRSNYFSGAYTAHAALQHWLGRAQRRSSADTETTATSRTPHSPQSQEPRHLIFTSSFVALFPIAGYAPYSPCKAALKSLHDSLSMEVELYNAAPPTAFPGSVKPPPIKIHTLYPATIYSEGFEREQRLKSDLAKMLEEGDEGQTPAEVARLAIRGLERGHEVVDTALMTRAVRTSVLGASKRVGGWFSLDTLLSCVMALFSVMVIVRADMDAKVRRFGRDHGVSGMKATAAPVNGK